MVSFLPWLLASALNVAQAAPGSGDNGLRAVKAGTKTGKHVKRRTLQEWREEQMRARAAKAKSKSSTPPPEPAVEESAKAPPPAPDAQTPDALPTEAVKQKSKRSKAKRTDAEPQPGWIKRYARELEALIALLTLWLITRIYGQTSAKNARKPPPRPSPISAEELGRIVFGIGRGKDVDAYRALYLNGAEAMQILGADQAERYLSGRSQAALEMACAQLAGQLPSGSSYIKTELSPLHQCILHVANPDGTGRTVEVGTVAEVGAVLRLVTPMTQTEPQSQA
jgi:hypothetical protein